MGLLFGHKTIAATIASNASGMSTGVFIGGFNQIAFEVPTAACGCLTASINVYATVSQDNSTYRPLYIHDINGICDTWKITANTGNFNAIVPAAGYNYIKFHTNGTASAASFFCKIHAMNV